jgi:uncharacterized repeat protein (TIGR03847 family)
VDLGLVTDLRAESFGEPGRRTFRLYATTPEGEASLWLEKEQIVMLGSAVSELLQRVPESQGQEPASTVGASFMGELDVRVGSLTIGYDAGQSGFTVEATDFESTMGIESIRLLASRSQFAGVADRIDEIVAASRPRCPLCGTPLTGGPHFCPESNGHGALTALE